MSRIFPFAVALLLAGCALQRAQIAQQAQVGMVGMSKEQILTCMGPPANRAAEGQTEVWAYATMPTMDVDEGTGSTRYCGVNLTMRSWRVSAVNYQGPTGGLITQDEQCAYVVDKCVVR